MLTGESLSVDKQVDATPGAPLAERRCMLFAGTTVVAGTAVALVTAIGADTQQRRAADLISGELSSDIGLQHQLGQLTNRALPISMSGGAVVGALGLVRRTPVAARGVQRHRHRGRRGSRRDAAGRDAGASGVGPTIDEVRCAGSGSAFGGGPRPHRSGLLRQDRNAQREPAAGVAGPPGRAIRMPRKQRCCAARRTPRRRRRAVRRRTRPTSPLSRALPTQRVPSTAAMRPEPHRAPAVPLRPGILGFGDGHRADRQRRTRSGAGRIWDTTR